MADIAQAQPSWPPPPARTKERHLVSYPTCICFESQVPKRKWGMDHHLLPLQGVLGHQAHLYRIWVQLALQMLSTAQDAPHWDQAGFPSQAHLHLVWVQLALQKVRLGLQISLQRPGETVPLGAALLEGDLIERGSCKAGTLLPGVTACCSA